MNTYVYKILAVLFLTLANTSAYANTIFSDSHNQLSMSGGQTTHKDIGDVYYFDVSYSQPTTFFRQEARRNLEVGHFQSYLINGGENTNLTRYKVNFFGLSEDVVLFDFGNFYTTARLGLYLKDVTDDRIGSKVTFGESISFGYRTNKLIIELFGRHFSNGSLTEYNAGHDFLGMRVGINY